MSTYHVSFFKNLLAPMDTRSSAYNGELTSLMWKVLRKPHSRRRERSKRSMDVLGSCMQIRSKINADPGQLIETRSNVRAIWPS